MIMGRPDPASTNNYHDILINKFTTKDSKFL